MRVTHVELKDFRNYKELTLELGAGPTLIVGSNGQGKTNLVEALGFLSTLGSHRVSTDHAMVRQAMDAAIVRVRLEHNDRKFLAEVQINRSGANRAQINRSVIRTRELPRYFSSVLFAPEDLALVRGEPSGRRRFIDDLLVLRSPRFSGVMSDYERVVKQRNMLLKSARASGVRDTQLSTLDVWDERLVAFGAEIISARSALIADLTPEVARAYEQIVGADHGASLANSLSIISRQDDPDNAVATNAVGEIISVADATTAFTAALASVRKAERDRAITLVGPHRDDLIFGLNGLPARGYASHGESWSFALALKLASAELLRRDSSAGDPVLILDDVFAELDQSRRERLASSISGFEQVLITAAVFGDVPEELAANVVRIKAGEVIVGE
ncbi:DNA replication and repair protein RecF [Salinibacterium amurskyense]|uniref:DNA replication and repair protein RecF n=1 Tax=Salinibacterium amurskyense TaxID=205941 RepID=A0A2M9D5Q9_9MICO|nr:DNA replication/repair protein RecF [Salinibacterium amurskyense]PJJ81056.1 DNA replication and repair protein RecF [Salinibacterium amurskyense]RLQ83086.1 DNA replication/repair protein RecF [Salinibacterium amurskyense]GHD81711.1 DNA replication and repair protein RecF [Salinibacterium amurskyense]